MSKALIFMAGLAVLAGCGVDGAPVRPEASVTPGVSVTGDAMVGVRTDRKG